MQKPLTPASDLDSAAISRRDRWRALLDRAARYGVAGGGIGVIAALALIFFYLLSVVTPLFWPAQARPVAGYALPGGGAATLALALEEQAEQAVRYTADGRAVFFRSADGAVLLEQALVPPGARLAAVARARTERSHVALALDDGSVRVAAHRFEPLYRGEGRRIVPRLEWPYGEQPLPLLAQGGMQRLAYYEDGERLLFLVADAAHGLHLVRFDKVQDFAGGVPRLVCSAQALGPAPVAPDFLLLAPDQGRFYVAARSGEVAHFALAADGGVRLLETRRLTEPGVELGALRLLVGGWSLLAGRSDGTLAQWFPVRAADNTYALQEIRRFHGQRAPITTLAPEAWRKGFLAGDADGRVGVYHSTSGRTLLVAELGQQPLRALAAAPGNDALLALSEAGAHFWQLHNEHPEIAFSTLWQPVHYEGYAEPRYVWQSSAASSDFEPKLSLVPLVFGTLKAAFYALLVAVPLAVLGAVYTAYFMAPRMRRLVKPTVEIMEALPTVILGFLAGLWLAPYVEEHLPGIFALLLALPLGFVLFGYLWRQLPQRLRRLLPEGWEAALLLPVAILLGWGVLELSRPLELLLFGGDMRAWLNGFGIDYDQRNAIVVGAAMGFAVIPTIFSIAEDAIYGVPRHLAFGSLALGATPWQTLTRVVILTASPGIFSAVMIGVGRAVGETMIVLMATGNTPVMDFSLFEGMRTLAANIAVEMPESAVDSTHYRVLFLAALVLFLFTFAVNTLAEVVRQRLRRKYSSL